jgi:hypothetical protein
VERRREKIEFEKIYATKTCQLFHNLDFYHFIVAVAVSGEAKTKRELELFEACCLLTNDSDALGWELGLACMALLETGE